MNFSFLPFLLLLTSLLACQPQNQSDTTNAEMVSNYDWMMLPFVKEDAANPVLTPAPATVFECPIRKEKVNWEVKDVFNPAAIVRNDTVFLIYRAEDSVGRHNGTSRIGLATSTDGLHFNRMPEPVFYPDNDFMKPVEWEGGCEDPRVVEDTAGTYFMTYTAYNGELARLCVASSPDLVHWKKEGLAFANAYQGKYKETWSKSGSVVCRLQGNKMVATPVNGLYYMYWGDTHLFLATSEDLIHWTPLEDENGELQPVLSPREKYFDSDLVEPGPPALLTDEGILLIYNARNAPQPKGDPGLAEFTYAAGQALFRADDPSTLISRGDSNFFKPEKDYELTGQVNKVCFLEGLAYFKNQWLLYYGTADSKIAVATHKP